MSLIEQLGGYDKASKLFKGCPWDDGIVDVPNPMAEGMLRLDLGELNIELLEHRRANNIFEVGDKVVVKDQPFWPEDYVIHTVEQEHIGKWYMSAWRHATQQEIEAGNRL